MRNRKQPAPGCLVRLEATSVYTGKRPPKLAGFWTPIKKRKVFRELGRVTYHARHT